MEAMSGQIPSAHYRNFQGNGYQYVQGTYQQQQFPGGHSGHPGMYAQQYDSRPRTNNYYSTGGYYTHTQPPAPAQVAYGYFTEVQKTPLEPKGRPRASSDDESRPRATPTSSPPTSLTLDAAIPPTTSFTPSFDLDPSDDTPDDRPRCSSIPTLPTNKHPTKRRPNYGEPSSKQRKPLLRRPNEPTDTYTLPLLASLPSPRPPCPSPPSTLTSTEYRRIFDQLNTQFCVSAFTWLSRYQFRIPKKSSMKEHTSPADRELTEYVHIIRTLIIQRDVPRTAVRDERVNELDSVMEGAAEIRHVAIHVSRKQKPDQRVLGFIAAVSEFCWVLGDAAGAAEMNRLYSDIEAVTRDRQEREGRGSPGVEVGV
ncbi:hypothetical protein EX30DRAFT_124715 [Ascodesmis nigricans]|uniref:Uncharacterized protein n=1 Tax=Ascodesmis nigricans TaxID=341454 RepID=A0A4S2MRU0_9PEZI|nr:hypothetical protein EX30DRAFT_124715 [Ascodesmis nigricans]